MAETGLKNYDSTIMWMAGNIAAGLVGRRDMDPSDTAWLADKSVTLARAIVAEVLRTA